MIADPRRAWRLPFIHVEAVVDLLCFQQARQPALRAEFRQSKNLRGLRLTHLFARLLAMALQVNSVFPQNPLNLARITQQSLEPGSIGDDRLETLLELLVQANSAGLR